MKITPFSFLVASILSAVGAPTVMLADDYEALPPRITVKTEAEALQKAGTHVYPVKGTGSMKPYIPESDDPDRVVAILKVDNPPYEELKKGDLVIFRANGTQVVHQIAAAQGDKWITTGIDNARYDGPALSRETFVSRVVCVYVIDPKAPGTPEPAEKSVQ